MRATVHSRLGRAIDFWENVQREIEKEIRPSTFEYIDLHDAELLYVIGYGFGGWVAVVGHPDHGSYEWVARRDGETDPQEGPPRYEFSNLGYGCSSSALRDGLTTMLG